MSRALIPLAMTVAMLVPVSGASATGPGGWDHLGTGATAGSGGLDGRVDALHVASPTALYAGGVFTTAGTAAAASIARWDGTEWHPLTNAPALNGGVDAIAVDGTNVYVGGQFTNAGGDPNADFVAEWDGTSWKPVCGSVTASVAALQIIGRTLYIGGSFADGAGLPSADKLVACNLDTGTPSSTVDTSEDINGAIYALTADSAGRLYAAGTFINMDQIPNASHVAMYDGTWHAMQAGAVDGITRSITSDGTNVYIGSDSVDIAGIAQADHVAKWNGSGWSALGSNTAGTDGYFPETAFINGLAASGSTVYATGSFQNANGQATADEIVGFNGFSWSPMGSDGAGNGPLPGPGNAIALFAGQAVVGGNFTTAGGDTRAGYIARYPGAAHPLKAEIRLTPAGLSAYVPSTGVFDGGASDGDAPITSYHWSFNDGTPDATGVQVSHPMTKQGTNTITLKVTDSLGATASTSKDFFLYGQYPEARFTYAPAPVFVGDSIAFDGSGSHDTDGTIASYDWDWADGTGHAHAAKPTHAFTKVGTYQVALLVTDDNTQSIGVLHNVVVQPLVLPAVSRASATHATFRVGPLPTAVSHALAFDARAQARAPAGTKLTFSLKAPAKVVVTIRRVADGVRVGTLTRKHLHNGKNAIAFSGRIGNRPLPPAAYRATLTATNKKGKAKPVRIRFTVVN